MGITLRTQLLALAFLIGACTNQPRQPTQPQSAVAPSTRYISSSGERIAEVPITGDVNTDAKSLAEAKRAGYKLVNTNGEELYCRTDFKTGSHVQRETKCLTALQILDVHDRTAQGLNQLGVVPPTVPAGHN
jgi:hypothetical protein